MYVLGYVDNVLIIIAVYKNGPIPVRRRAVKTELFLGLYFR